MVSVRFNEEVLWLTEDGWKNLKGILKVGDKIEVLEVEDDD